MAELVHPGTTASLHCMPCGPATHLVPVVLPACSYDISTIASVIPAFASRQDLLVIDDGVSYPIQQVRVNLLLTHSPQSSGVW